MKNLTLVFGDDAGENGLWRGDKMVASLRELETAGYSLYYLLGTSQKRLETIARQFGNN